MNEKRKPKRINSGALIDPILYHKLQIAAAEDKKKVGHAMDEAIELYLQNRRKWPDEEDENEH
jgi:hypothetical protein